MGLPAVAELCLGVESTGHPDTLLSNIPPALKPTTGFINLVITGQMEGR